MKASAFDYGASPRPAIVLGCLLPAPWLGALAGLVLAFGPAAGSLRFAPAILAAVHVLTLGMLMPVMVGALLQMMPVVARAAVPGTRVLAPCVGLAGLTTALGLGAGFLSGAPTGFGIAVWLGAPFFIVAGLALLGAGIRSARRIDPVHKDATTRTLACIGAALLATAATGAALAGTYAGYWPTNVAPLRASHVAWGLSGWIATLVIGVAATVAPMLWQARSMPPWLERFVPWGIWLSLLAFCAAVVDVPALALPSAVPLLVLLGVLAAAGLRGMLAARRRHDAGWRLWVVAWSSGIVAAGLALAAPAFPRPDAVHWWIGTMALVGCGVLPISAMLGKIVPFLVWLHLRRGIAAPARVPPMQAIVAPVAQARQARLVLLAYALLLAVPLAPRWAMPAAGLVFAAANIGLGMLLIGAARCFRRTLAAGGLSPREGRVPMEGDGAPARSGIHHADDAAETGIDLGELGGDSTRQIR